MGWTGITNYKMKACTKLPVIVYPVHDNGQEGMAIAWGPCIKQ